MPLNNNGYIYLSFSAEDYPRVSSYILKLENSGYSLKYTFSSKTWTDKNAKEIAQSEVFVVFVSENSNLDAKITSEINYASACEKPFVSIHLDDIQVSSLRESIFKANTALLAYDLTQNEAIDELNTVIKRIAGKIITKTRVKKHMAAVCLACLMVFAAAVMGVIFLSTRIETDPQIYSGFANSSNMLEDSSSQAFHTKNSDGGASANVYVEIPQIDICTLFSQDDATSDSYDKLFFEYSDRLTQVVFNDKSFSDYEEYLSYINERFAENDVPDIFTVNYDMIDYLDKNLLVDYDTIVVEYPDFAGNYYDSALSSARDENGKIYALPIRGYWQGLFCNEDVFERENLALPTDWDNFNTAIDAFSQSDVTPIAASIGLVPNYWTDNLILSYSTTEDYLANPSTYEEIPVSWFDALDFFSAMADKQPFPQDTMTIRETKVNSLFLKKKAAMKLDGSWFCGAAAEAQAVTVLPMPSAANDSGKVIGGYSIGWAISKDAWDDTAKRENCISFITYMTSKESLGEFCKYGAAAPAPVTLPESSSEVVISGLNMVSYAQTHSGKFVPPLSNVIDKKTSASLYTGVSSMLEEDIDGHTLLDRIY